MKHIRMNSDEERACEYLLMLDRGPVQFEPLGCQLPPDFSLNYDTGVEVRRMNETFANGNQRLGLEEDAVPFLTLAQDLAHGFPTPLSALPSDPSWFVNLIFTGHCLQLLS